MEILAGLTCALAIHGSIAGTLISTPFSGLVGTIALSSSNLATGAIVYFPLLHVWPTV